LKKIKPDAVVFLGDSNTVAGCIAPALLNIPIAHIEGGMRSYDWRMPEEKYRVISDHTADLIYVYFEEYKKQAIREGINPGNIVVVGNPIVDIVKQFYLKRKKHFDKLANDKFFSKRKIEKDEYYLMTCHRRENVHDPGAFRAIINLVSKSPRTIYFPASYRTQRVIKEMGLKIPDRIIMVDPIGYEEFFTLMVNSRGVLTDSGTVVEEACILNIPSVQMRKSTERPQVYDAGGTVKFDPTKPRKYSVKTVYKKLNSLYGKKWEHGLGDGKASIRIARDLASRVTKNNLRGHLPEKYHIPISRSYREDKIKV
jgi:UDP-N-acetylglucosamine 2-epimerase (non-hydrolysing)